MYVFISFFICLFGDVQQLKDMVVIMYVILVQIWAIPVH